MTTVAPPSLPSSPAPVTDARAALRELFGYADFRAGQEEIVSAVLAGEDVLAVMPTGAGKSLCYQLPAMLLPGCTVVISPLVALMKDQIDALPPTLRERAAVFNSTIDRGELDAAGARLVAGDLKLVYVAPERLRQRPFLHALARARIARLVVDEAHCVSQWGHDFRPDYLFIPEVARMLGGPPVLLMTATATARIKEELAGQFGRRMRVVDTGVQRPNLELRVEVARNREEKLNRVLALCNEARGSGIIYATSRESTEAIAALLRREGVSARHYHAGLPRDERTDTQDAFLSGRVRIMAATVAFGMGVDKPDVRFIVHFNASRSLEAYAQEAGRAGRDGDSAICTLLWATSDGTALKRWASEEALTPDLLRAVYKAVRGSTRGRFTWWPAEALVEAVRDLGGFGRGGDDDDRSRGDRDTAVRVALGSLERVGVLRRHTDLPESARMRVLGDVSAIDQELADDLEAEPGATRVRSPMELAGVLGSSPVDIEERLLGAQDAGVLAYNGVGRGLLIELLPHPPDLADRLKGLIADSATSQEARVEEMRRYATVRECRALQIARHFGAPAARRCGNCDVCMGRPSPSSLPSDAGRGGDTPSPTLDRAPEDIILAALVELPFPMGRRGMARLLKGSVESTVREDRSDHFGALGNLSIKGIEAEIDRLVEGGYIDRDDGEYRLLSLTDKGAIKPLAPWPPPTRASARPPRERAPRGERDIVQDDEFDLDDPRTGERFAQLRSWRTDKARDERVSPFIVFPDRTLKALAAASIASADDLTRIPGFGPTKLAKYADELLQLLAE